MTFKNISFCAPLSLEPLTLNCFFLFLQKQSFLIHNLNLGNTLNTDLNYYWWEFYSNLHVGLS